ncbi:MAG: HAD family phosphatase [Spirochaetes bacterium]|nr:HAD family phosphatase [Spirochaetota bacterium]
MFFIVTSFKINEKIEKGVISKINEKKRMLDKTMNNAREMVVTDLDGTLLQTRRKVSNADIDTLEKLQQRGIIRVVATGRSFYSVSSVLKSGFPIDYLIFSSGAGIILWPTKKIISKHGMGAEDVRFAVNILIDLCIDFMVHKPIPLNHHFVYYESGRRNPDFFRRCDIYRRYGVREDFSSFQFGAACQIVAIVPQEDGHSIYSHLKKTLHTLKVIRTTSPIDGSSVWIEIFPPEVSKASAAEWICQQCGVSQKSVLAVGNDYNDLDLLAWAQAAFLVENAPEELKKKFKTVGSNNESGFTEAVERWIGKKNGEL